MIKNQIYDAAHVGDVKEVEAWLTKNPSDLNSNISDGLSLLHIAAAFGQEQLVSHLLDRGALVNKNAENQTNETPLHLATLYRDDETASRVVDRLIANGAELNAPQRGGQTALHHAVARGSKPIVETLVLAGADPMLKDQMGRSPIDLAKFDEDIKALLKKSTKLV